MPAAGDTFLIQDAHGTEHLHIVVSDPRVDPHHIVLVPVTTWEDYKDDTCILDADDIKGIPFLGHESCVDFQEALLTSEQRLAAAVASKKARHHKPVPMALVEKIRSRACESRRIPNKCLMTLEAQNLV